MMPNWETANAQAKAFMSYINSDEYLSTRKGDFTERNGGRTPWNVTVDLKLSHSIKVSNGHEIQFSLDIINATNLLNKDWGRLYFSPNTFNSTASVGLSRVNSGTASDPTYKFAAPSTPYTVDQLGSRWQMQAGVRYTF